MCITSKSYCNADYKAKLIAITKTKQMLPERLSGLEHTDRVGELEHTRNCVPASANTRIVLPGSKTQIVLSILQTQIVLPGSKTQIVVPVLQTRIVLPDLKTQIVVGEFQHTRNCALRFGRVWLYDNVIFF